MPFAIDSNTIRHYAAVVSFRSGGSGIYVHELLGVIADFCLQNPMHESFYGLDQEITDALARLSGCLRGSEKRDDDDNLDLI